MTSQSPNALHTSTSPDSRRPELPSTRTRLSYNKTLMSRKPAPPAQMFHPVVEELIRNFQAGTVVRQLLLYLATRSFPENRPEERTASAVAAHFKWGKVGTASRTCKRLREALDEYYRNPANGAPNSRVSICGGGQAVRKEGRNWLVIVEPCGESLTHRFWSPHVAAESEIEIVSNAPLFFRSPDATQRIRFMAVNSSKNLANNRENDDLGLIYGFQESYHYVSLGDFRFALMLTRYFSQFQHNVSTKIVYASRDADDPLNPADVIQLPQSSNLIVIGNRRVSWLVRYIEDQLAPNFFISDDSLDRFENRGPIAARDEKTHYQDVLAKNGVIHASVIRNVEDGRVETLINVQNGPALENIGNLLTSDALLKPVFDEMRWTETADIPEKFELFFMIQMGGKEVPKRRIPPTLIAHRP